jgi:hypothetical protein
LPKKKSSSIGEKFPPEKPSMGGQIKGGEMKGSEAGVVFTTTEAIRDGIK